MFNPWFALNTLALTVGEDALFLAPAPRPSGQKSRRTVAQDRRRAAKVRALKRAKARGQA